MRIEIIWEGDVAPELIYYDGYFIELNGNIKGIKIHSSGETTNE